jgi:hypothetical protein
MITTTVEDETVPPARDLPRIFSNHARCASCQSTAIRVHFCPSCPKASGGHMHRECRCGAIWMERFAAHAPIDLNLDDAAFVAICQHCRSRLSHVQAMQPRCCRQPAVGYHDTREPCALCTVEREPGEEG